VYIAVGYRSLTLKYYYMSGSKVELEEFVDISMDGSMRLDPSRTYNKADRPETTIGHLEAMPKVAWDGVQALEYVINNADELGVDVHQVIFTGVSAGSSICNYLTWIYWQDNQQRFTVKALGLKVAQLNYPNPPHMESDLHLFADSVASGKAAKLTDYFNVGGDITDCIADFANIACNEDVANAICGGVSFEYDWCNRSAYQQQMSAICQNKSLSQMTLGDAMSLSTWAPSKNQPYLNALRRFWYHEENMHNAKNKNVYVYALSMYNGSDGQSVAHHSAFTKAYAKAASKADIPFVTYYTDFKGMKPELITEKYTCKQESANSNQVFVNKTVEYNYESNFAWRSIWDAAEPEGLADSWTLTTGEFGAFMCYALGRNCHIIR